MSLQQLLAINKANEREIARLRNDYDRRQKEDSYEPSWKMWQSRCEESEKGRRRLQKENDRLRSQSAAQWEDRCIILEQELAQANEREQADRKSRQEYWDELDCALEKDNEKRRATDAQHHREQNDKDEQLRVLRMDRDYFKREWVRDSHERRVMRNEKSEEIRKLEVKLHDQERKASEQIRMLKAEMHSQQQEASKKVSSLQLELEQQKCDQDEHVRSLHTERDQLKLECDSRIADKQREIENERQQFKEEIASRIASEQRAMRSELEEVKRQRATLIESERLAVEAEREQLDIERARRNAEELRTVQRERDLLKDECKRRVAKEQAKLQQHTAIHCKLVREATQLREELTRKQLVETSNDGVYDDSAYVRASTPPTDYDESECASVDSSVMENEQRQRISATSGSRSPMKPVLQAVSKVTTAARRFFTRAAPIQVDGIRQENQAPSLKSFSYGGISVSRPLFSSWDSLKE